MVWDGLGFFGFDDTKLERLKGKPLTFCTKFGSIKWILISFSSLIIIIIVLIMEATKYGDQKSKSLSLVEKDAYSYNIQDTLPLRYVHWYWLSELFPRIRQFQL